VVVQADELLGLSTVLVSPTVTRARAATFRPAIAIDGELTRVLIEQTTVVDPSDSVLSPDG
jgi:mRNA interferase MazF